MLGFIGGGAVNRSFSRRRRPVLCLELLKHRDFSRPQSHIGNCLIAEQVATGSDLLLQCALNIAERKFRITVTAPVQQIFEESYPVGFGREPLLPESRQVVVRFMRCTA